MFGLHRGELGFHRPFELVLDGKLYDTHNGDYLRLLLMSLYACSQADNSD